MAYNAGQLTAGLSLDFRQFTASLRQVVQEVRNVGKQFQDAFNQAAGSMNNMGNAAKQIQRDFKDMNRIVSGILMSQAFYNTTNAIEDAASSLLDFMNNMQQAQIAMEYFLGTPERAQGFIANMKEFAATTAFSTEQALDLSRRLMAAQFKPEEIRSVMTILADAASATGATADQMDRVVLALTQIRTNGRLAGQELRQLAEAGIPVYQILQEQLGLTQEQLMNIGKLKIPSDLAIVAILKGLEERYKGAAQRVADTVPGMWSTIKDDSLILGEAIFKAPYKALENFLRTWRDTWEKARQALYQSGIGGVINTMFSPPIQQAIRSIVGSISSLAKSFAILRQAMAPVATILNQTFVQALGITMPIIAGVVRLLANLISVSFQAVPPLRYLAVALMGLLIARITARSLLFLWSVLRLGVIAKAIAQAINILRASIQALYLTMVRNPIAAVVMIIAGALLYLALSSETVTRWLDQLMKRLSALAGFKMDDVLKPTEQNTDDWANQFNQNVSGIDQNLKDIAKGIIQVGDEAKKSGKKVKDTFIAAFDEVFQVPDLNKKLEDSMPNVGLPATMGPQLPGTQLPKEIKTPTIVPDVKWPDLPDWLNGTPLLVRINVEPPEWPKPPDFPTAVATAWVASMNAIRAAMAAAAQAADALGAALGSLRGVLEGLGGLVPGLVGVLNGLPIPLINMGQAVVDLVGKLNLIPPAIEQVRVPVANWVAELGNVPVALGNVGLAIAGLIPQLALMPPALSLVGQAVGGLQNAFNGLAANVPALLGPIGATVGAWATGIQQAFGGLVSTVPPLWDQVWSNVEVMLQTHGLNVTTWLSTNVPQWVTSLATAGAQMGLNWSTNWSGILATLITSGTQIAANLGTYTSQWYNTLATKVSQMTSKVSEFKNNLLTNIQTAASNLSAKWSPEWEKFKSTISTGLDKIKGFWDRHKTGILITAGAIVAGIILVFAGLPEGILAAIGALLTRLGPALARIGPIFRTAIQNLPRIFSEILDLLPGGARTAISRIVQVFSELPGKIWDVIKSIPDKVAQVFSHIKLPNFNFSSTFGKLAEVTGFASGGVIDEESIVRVGEKGRREAIVPLESTNAMAPFARAVAAELSNMMPAAAAPAGGSGQPILYVGTLIADDRSLRELERRMRVIRASEQSRGVK
jgi:tape measure domain-containing protein